MECSSASMNMRIKAKNMKGTKGAEKKIVTSVPKSGGQLGVNCKVCMSLGDLSKMHICDYCENTFHIACCVEVTSFCSRRCWYNKRKPVTGGPMMQISSKFQADVPPQDDADCKDENYFGGMASTNFTGLNEWKFKNAVGNWIRCVGYKAKDKKDNKGAVGNNKKNEKGCGKWRRAPLSIEQPEEWDCSALVTWGQLPADCAVPQELPTSEVKKQLEFMKQVKDLVAAGGLEVVTETWCLA